MGHGERDNVSCVLHDLIGTFNTIRIHAGTLLMFHAMPPISRTDGFADFLP